MMSKPLIQSAIAEESGAVDGEDAPKEADKWKAKIS